MYIWELHKYDRCSNPFAMCEHQTFFRYLVIISHHQQRYRNHYYHHHQNHHHKHQLDKTIRVARVTTVVSHSAIIILRWQWGRSLILLQRRISGNGDSSSSASWGEARTPDDASQEAKTTGREYFLRAYHLDNLCSSKSDVRLRFWSWYDLKKLLNSTLGSVVPLAMFRNIISAFNLIAYCSQTQGKAVWSYKITFSYYER